MEYIRLSENYNKNRLIPITDNPHKYVNNTSPWFISMMRYNQADYDKWKNTGSLAGIEGSVTNKIWWDFDSTDLDKAQTDTLNLIEDLLHLGAKEENIQIAFSGSKGFSVVVETKQDLSLEQVKNTCFELAKNLETFDQKIYDNQRIFRLILTKNEKSGLYKIPLTVDELQNLTIDEIKLNAKAINYLNSEDLLAYYKPLILPEKYLIVPEKKEPIRIIAPLMDLDFSKKAKGWTNCKWSLLNGNFKEGERHYPILAIIATCKALNYPKETAYYMAKSASKLSLSRNGGEEFPKEEIWIEIEGVYSDNWKGGTFSCKDGKSPWLTNICNNLGQHKCKADDEKIFSDLTELSSIFDKFSKDIDKNKILTGIEELDEQVTILTSSLVGLLGNPGSGKTSLSINILNRCSKYNIPSIFFSMDMGIPLVYLKLIQKHYPNKRLSTDEIFHLYKTNKEEAKKIDEIIKENYGNVKFSFKSGLNVEEIKESIVTYQEQSGQKVKLVVVDYLECIAGPYSDSTANGGLIANKLKDLANETETCILLLLQTQKHSAAPDEPLLSMKNIKGASVIEQACSVILSVWREGYHPDYSAQDKFLSIATVKDRFGALWRSDFKWDGLRGLVSILNEVELEELKELKYNKKKNKEMSDKQWD